MSATTEFSNALTDIEEAYKRGLHAFCSWMQESWTMGGAAEWAKQYQEPYPGNAYRDGYNAAIQALEVALDCFLDEHGI